MQVKRMNKIYSTAFRVLIMTGGDVEDPEGTHQLFNRVMATTIKGESSPEQGKSFLETESIAAWKGVCDIAGRSYWNRLWILQEVFLANTGTLLCFGDKFCLLSAFFETCAILLADPSYAAQVLRSRTRGSIDAWPLLLRLNRIEDLLHLNAFKRRGAANPDILHLLDATRSACQHDSRDKVYGLLGILDQRIRDTIVPDYTKSIEDVYREFVVGVIKSTGKLDIIFQTSADRPPDIPPPSWVPIWTLPTTINKSGLIAARCFTNARASGDSLHLFQDSTMKDQLRCMGFRIDSVQQTACSHPPAEAHDTHNVTLSLERSEGPYPNSAAVREAIWKALSINGNALRGDLVFSMAFLLDVPFFGGRGASTNFFYLIDRFQQCNRDLVIAGAPFSSHFPKWTERFSDPPKEAELVASLTLLMNSLTCRRFIVTQNGFTGMAPRRTQQGDEIWIIKGSSTPLVLRNNGDETYHLVGECYRDRAMDGEAMEDVKTGKCQEIEVILR
ncbi:hypothetical protein F5Y16DRAFT_370921 [Xylariaceae sp. FL0255]|nr:hypothetical protein F5Y16DRAFT_370921 [Xylariaceae sp. FL0255]